MSKLGGCEGFENREKYSEFGEEQNLDSLAKRSLYSDPHLHPLPGRERRQTLTGRRESRRRTEAIAR
jgi:hypothetical protein